MGEFAQPKDSKYYSPFCLATFNREGGKPVSKIPLTEQEFNFLYCLTLGNPKGQTSLESFVADAIRGKLIHQRSDYFTALGYLKNAKNQSIALTQLMLDAETHRTMEGDLPDDERQSHNAGVSLLVQLTNDRLQDAFDDLFRILRPNNEEAA